MRQRAQAGFHLIEVVLVVALAGVLLAWSVPPLLDLNRRLRVEVAAHELMGVLRTARVYAVRHSVNVALKLYLAPGGGVSYALYRDGDGDGVRTADIEAGIDPPESPLRELAHFGSLVTFGFPPGEAPIDPGDPGKRLTNLDDPIRLGSSNMASFSPLGGSTPGSLYLTDGASQLSVVRIFGRTGKVKVLLYDREREVWE
jgi:prepilin-type N-terminal cleavage/methylation domain-containing protein